MAQRGSDTSAHRSSLLFLVRSPLATLRDYLRSFRHRPVVRPWALTGPILVLLVALPLLRPLRHPAQLSDDEALRLATVAALVETNSLALRSPPPSVPLASASQRDTVDRTDRLIEVNGRYYSNQPPVMAVMLSWPARLLHRMGFDVGPDGAVVAYVLTLLGVTLPVAGAAGIIYRMGRLFELPRPWRAGLAITVVAASGLLTYSVVLNPHAPAAVLLLCSAACLIHVTTAKLKRRGAGWVLLSGACAALAAGIDPPAGIVAALFVPVIAAMRMSIPARAAMLILYGIGMAGPIALHAAWSRPITGEFIPGARHARIALASVNRIAHALPEAVTVDSSAGAFAGQGGGRNDRAVDPIEPDADDVISPPSAWEVAGEYMSWVARGLFGAHGVLSHFPILFIGIAGIAAVMHRHWPSFVKMLAAASAAGAILIIAAYAAPLSDWGSAMFATRWFVVFTPLLLFWAGAWLRRSHSHLVWSLTGALLVFSVLVALVGMTDPYPGEGFHRYTAVEALNRLSLARDTDVAVAR